MTTNKKAASQASNQRETASETQKNNNSSPSKWQEQGDNSTASQRSKILKHLFTTGSLTTLQARHLLDCMHPAARCQELRQAGYPIDMVWVNDITPEGHVHRVGRYILKKSKQLSLFDWQVPGEAK